MAYEDFLRLGGRTDVPLRGCVTRRFAIENYGCPECGHQLTALYYCPSCGGVFGAEKLRLQRNFGEN